jgi:hypothetical protein
MTLSVRRVKGVSICTEREIPWTLAASVLKQFESFRSQISAKNIAITILDITHRPVFYLKLNSTL